MDTVYGTKKYFQSLSGASDIYRSQACRVVSNDYNYQNTLGRRSALGTYYHMNKQPSYTNDLSLTSQYGYNTWGIWRDGRNIAPSTFSAKTHQHYQKTRSFSIILTTAAFIVLLAVISIAGLAFYFSSIKANMEDPILGFEGSFRIAKGDLYSTGLKYNHTTTYKQKIDFYKRFVERALMDNNLQTIRTDVWGFGEGPLIKVSFRIFLDMRKLPQNIRSVEDYIKESIFLETTAAKSLYRSLRIDAESVEIKRILDEQVVKSASLFKEAQTVPTSQTQLEKRLMKKGGGASPPLLSKSGGPIKARTTPRPHSVDDEPDVDVENAPVIQGSFEGSFEITKTDADIARKKSTPHPTKAYSSASLPPKAVTPFSLRVKPKKPSIEKLTTIVPLQQTKPTTTSTTTTTTSTTTTSSTTTTTTTTPKPTTTTSTTTTTTPAPFTTTTKSTSFTTTHQPGPTQASNINKPNFPTIIPPTSTLSVPKLDANLFTSIPILDTQPWRPIHREVPELLPGPPPAFPTKTVPTVPTVTSSSSVSINNQHVPQRRIDEFELPFISDEPTPPAPAPAPVYEPYAPNFYGTKLRKPIEAKNPEEMVFYHGFGNPVYMPGTDGIERLGVGASVQPHPLPVPLIDDVIIPPFKPLNPTLGTVDKLPFDIEAGNEKFEHLGGGVIVKKHDRPHPNERPAIPTEPTISSTTTTIKEQTPISFIKSKISNKNVSNSELADSIGEFFMELLNLPKDEQNGTKEEKIESRIANESESSEKEFEKVSSSHNGQAATTTPQESSEDVSVSTTVEPPTTKPNFLNLKEIILQRKNSPTTIAPTTPKTETTTTTHTTTTTPKAIKTTKIPTSTSTTPASQTTKRIRIRPTHSKPPTILDDSNLFPSHSKWEFVNSSSSGNFGHTGNMRKVFNNTLHAWVSEDVDKNENSTLHDIKTRINNATNIQDISLIFDTLASKLGITPSVPNKVPPFSQNKLKQKNEIRSKTTVTTTKATTTTPTRKVTTSSPTQKTTSKITKPTIKTTTTRATTTTTTSTTAAPLSLSPTTQHFIELPIQQHEPFIKPLSGFGDDSSSAEGIGAAIPVVGEAEVEVIDPVKYEEMLRSSQFAEATTTETAPKLVTLLPVRSNSGIRFNRPLEEFRSSDSTTGIGSSSVISEEVASSLSSESISSPTGFSNSGLITKAGQQIIKRKSQLEQSRRFPPAETVIKGGLRVTVK